MNPLNPTLFRVVIRTTASYQPGRDQDWSHEVAYCGEEYSRARSVYYSVNMRDYNRGPGNTKRETVVHSIGPDGTIKDITSAM